MKKRSQEQVLGTEGRGAGLTDLLRECFIALMLHLTC